MADVPGMSNVLEASRVVVNENMYIPYKGMVFDKEQDAYEFYNNHGEKVGFNVRIQAARRNKDGHYGNRIYVCSKQGFRRPDKRQHVIKNPRAETRMGCGAAMKIRFEKSIGKYIVYSFTAEHNHEVTRPNLAHILPSQQRQMIGGGGGGRKCAGFSDAGARNYLRTKRQRGFPYGEAGSILRYFQGRATRFHALQFDCEEKITNVFWADAQMIDDYMHFGDAVSCDTTYKFHKDSRPLVVFFGFNHHREVTIFGAAFMYDETTDSFIWLFETFLRTMSNKHPKTIFTDQDYTMAKALAKVMPNTFHRLWKGYIMQSALNYVPRIFGDFSTIFGRLLDEPEEEHEWLSAWHAMLDEFNATENMWLKMMFELRKKWAPPYVRWHWLGGMRSIDLLDRLRQDSGLYELFTYFESLLDERRDKERQDDDVRCNELPEDKVPVRFLQHAGQIYTKIIFEDIREEFIMSLETDLMERGKEGIYEFFIISPPPGRNKSHRVTRDGNYKLSCSCRLFDTQGILCGHMIKVLREVMCIHEVPCTYITKRWTKEARFVNVNDVLGCIGDRDCKKDSKKIVDLRYKELMALYSKIAWRASENEEIHEMAMKQAIELFNKVERMRKNVQVSDPNHSEVGSTSEVVLTEVGSRSK